MKLNLFVAVDGTYLLGSVDGHGRLVVTSLDADVQGIGNPYDLTVGSWTFVGKYKYAVIRSSQPFKQSPIKVSGPNSVTHRKCTPIFECCIGSKNGIQK